MRYDTIKEMQNAKHSEKSGVYAAAVAGGIFISRISGFIRDRALAHYLGNSEAAGAFRAALRIPNLLQNLFGEGVLSASFIPVYSRLLAEGKQEEAQKLGGTIMALLMLSMSVLVGLGILFTRPLISVLAPGFEGEVRELTIRLVRILFPSAGLLVLSAWCLGVLNSHRKFFLSYVAPVVWNAAIIATLFIFGARYSHSPAAEMELTELVALGTVMGSLLQLLIQIPKAWQLNGRLIFSRYFKGEYTNKVVHGFFPALLSRGVVQISAYIDQILSSFLGASIVSALGYAQTLALLPVSLFGMSISSAELPALSSVTGSAEEVAAKLKERLSLGLSRISFFVIPSVLVFLVLGNYVVGFVYQTGKFQSQDTIMVWWILAGYAIGLLATTRARLCVSVFWSFHDTKTPAKIAFLRVMINAVISCGIVFFLGERLALENFQIAMLLGVSASVTGWVEFLIIRKLLMQKIGKFLLGGPQEPKMWVAGFVASLVGYGVGRVVVFHPLINGVLVLGVFGVAYLLLAIQLRINEAAALYSMVKRRFG